MQKKNKNSMVLSARSQFLNILFIVALLVLTFLFLSKNFEKLTGAGDFDLSTIDFRKVSYLWLLPALLCLCLSVSFEAFNLMILTRKVGHKRSYQQSLVYASSDLYFSAITPSATGGQPAAAYYMTKSGIPLALSSAVLILNVTLYTIGLIVISILSFLLRPDFFLSFSGLEKACVLIGVGFHLILIIVCIILMTSKKIVFLFGDILYWVLSKLRFVKDKEERIRSFRASVESYRDAFRIFKENKWTIPLLLFNAIMQRVILAPITYFVFLALGPVGIPTASFLEIFAMQLYCTIGASALPLPGGAAIGETLYISMFSACVSGVNASSLCMASLLFSRGISVYLCVIVCGVITIVHHMRMKKAERERLKMDEMVHEKTDIIEE